MPVRNGFYYDTPVWEGIMCIVCLRKGCCDLRLPISGSGEYRRGLYYIFIIFLHFSFLIYFTT